jgi:hypothetical protein
LYRQRKWSGGQSLYCQDSTRRFIVVSQGYQKNQIGVINSSLCHEFHTSSSSLFAADNQKSIENAADTSRGENK